MEDGSLEWLVVNLHWYAESEDFSHDELVFSWGNIPWIKDSTALSWENVPEGMGEDAIIFAENKNTIRYNLYDFYMPNDPRIHFQTVPDSDLVQHVLDFVPEASFLVAARGLDAAATTETVTLPNGRVCREAGIDKKRMLEIEFLYAVHEFGSNYQHVESEDAWVSAKTGSGMFFGRRPMAGETRITGLQIVLSVIALWSIAQFAAYWKIRHKA